MKITINLDDVDSNALEYILDLIEQDFIRAGGVNNGMRGSRLFQEINVLKNRLKQEISIARDKEYAATHTYEYTHKKNPVKFHSVESKEDFDEVFKSWRFDK